MHKPSRKAGCPGHWGKKLGVDVLSQQPLGQSRLIETAGAISGIPLTEQGGRLPACLGSGPEFLCEPWGKIQGALQT